MDLYNLRYAAGPSLCNFFFSTFFAFASHLIVRTVRACESRCASFDTRIRWKTIRMRNNFVYRLNWRTYSISRGSGSTKHWLIVRCSHRRIRVCARRPSEQGEKNKARRKKRNGHTLLRSHCANRTRNTKWISKQNKMKIQRDMLTPLCGVRANETNKRTNERKTKLGQNVHESN